MRRDNDGAAGGGVNGKEEMGGMHGMHGMNNMDPMDTMDVLETESDRNRAWRFGTSTWSNKSISALRAKR